jgi:hypothetical protein
MLREEHKLSVLKIGCWGKILKQRGSSEQGSGKNFATRSFMICAYPRYYSGEKIKKNELG